MPENGETIEPNEVHFSGEEVKTFKISMNLSKLVLGVAGVVAGGLLIKKLVSTNKESPHEKLIDLQIKKQMLELNNSFDQPKQQPSLNIEDVKSLIREEIGNASKDKKS